MHCTHGGVGRRHRTKRVQHPPLPTVAARAQPAQKTLPSRSQQCVLKMADGLCTADAVSNVNDETAVKKYDNGAGCENNDSVNGRACENVRSYCVSSDSEKLFDKLCAVVNKGSTTVVVVEAKHEEFSDMEMPSCVLTEEDCRKKRCVDRYDSSESSDRLVHLFKSYLIKNTQVC